MRSLEHQFVSTDTSLLIEEMLAEYENRTSITVAPGSPENLMIHWVASVLVQMLVKINYAANQNIPSSAENENLDALAELFFAQKRKSATPAVCTVRFRISTVRTTATLIPAGTRVTDTGQNLYWRTQQDTYIPAGSQFTDISVTCQTTGTIGNGWPAGQINTLVDIYDYYSGCENITDSDGGADEQTDDELYEAMLASMEAPSTAGSRSGYIYHAKSASTEISDVAVCSPLPGEIRIYALMKDGTVASETMKQAIFEKCSADDVRPLADHLEIGDPEILNYTIKLTYWIPSGTNNAAQIEDAVSEAVRRYVEWQSAKLGRDLNPSVLINYIMQTGVKRVEIESPVYTPVPSGSDTTVPAVALIANYETDITIINGGMEDE